MSDDGPTLVPLCTALSPRRTTSATTLISPRLSAVRNALNGRSTTTVSPRVLRSSYALAKAPARSSAPPSHSTVWGDGDGDDEEEDDATARLTCPEWLLGSLVEWAEVDPMIAEETMAMLQDGKASLGSPQGGGGLMHGSPALPFGGGSPPPFDKQSSFDKHRPHGDGWGVEEGEAMEDEEDENGSPNHFYRAPWATGGEGEHSTPQYHRPSYTPSSTGASGGKTKPKVPPPQKQPSTPAPIIKKASSSASSSSSSAKKSSKKPSRTNSTAANTAFNSASLTDRTPGGSSSASSKSSRRRTTPTVTPSLAAAAATTTTTPGTDQSGAPTAPAASRRLAASSAPSPSAGAPARPPRREVATSLANAAPTRERRVRFEVDEKKEEEEDDEHAPPLTPPPSSISSSSYGRKPTRSTPQPVPDLEPSSPGRQAAERLAAAENKAAKALAAAEKRANFDDCGRCVNCLDKVKFGGPGRKRQACGQPKPKGQADEKEEEEEEEVKEEEPVKPRKRPRKEERKEQKPIVEPEDEEEEEEAEAKAARYTSAQSDRSSQEMARAYALGWRACVVPASQLASLIPSGFGKHGSNSVSKDLIVYKKVGQADGTPLDERTTLMLSKKALLKSEAGASVDKEARDGFDVEAFFGGKLSKKDLKRLVKMLPY